MAAIDAIYLDRSILAVGSRSSDEGGSVPRGAIALDTRVDGEKDKNSEVTCYEMVRWRSIQLLLGFIRLSTRW
jgi:hypothetical protein